jgi:hypothetical protein
MTERESDQRTVDAVVKQIHGQGIRSGEIPDRIAQLDYSAPSIDGRPQFIEYE